MGLTLLVLPSARSSYAEMLTVTQLMLLCFYALLAYFDVV